MIKNNKNKRTTFYCTKKQFPKEPTISEATSLSHNLKIAKFDFKVTMYNSEYYKRSKQNISLSYKNRNIPTTNKHKQNEQMAKNTTSKKKVEPSKLSVVNKKKGGPTTPKPKEKPKKIEVPEEVGEGSSNDNIEKNRDLRVFKYNGIHVEDNKLNSGSQPKNKKAKTAETPTRQSPRNAAKIPEKWEDYAEEEEKESSEPEDASDADVEIVENEEMEEEEEEQEGLEEGKPQAEAEANKLANDREDKRREEESQRTYAEMKEKARKANEALKRAKPMNSSLPVTEITDWFDQNPKEAFNKIVDMTNDYINPSLNLREPELLVLSVEDQRLLNMDFSGSSTTAKETSESIENLEVTLSKVKETDTLESIMNHVEEKFKIKLDRANCRERSRKVILRCYAEVDKLKFKGFADNTIKFEYMGGRFKYSHAFTAWDQAEDNYNFSDDAAIVLEAITNMQIGDETIQTGLTGVFKINFSAEDRWIVESKTGSRFVSVVKGTRKSIYEVRRINQYAATENKNWKKYSLSGMALEENTERNIANVVFLILSQLKDNLREFRDDAASISLETCTIMPLVTKTRQNLVTTEAGFWMKGQVTVLVDMLVRRTKLMTAKGVKEIYAFHEGTTDRNKKAH